MTLYLNRGQTDISQISAAFTNSFLGRPGPIGIFPAFQIQFDGGVVQSHRFSFSNEKPPFPSMYITLNQLPISPNFEILQKAISTKVFTDFEHLFLASFHGHTEATA
jgi:hypothetical protein